MALKDFLKQIEELIEQKLEAFALKHGLIGKANVVVAGAQGTVAEAKDAVQKVASDVASGDLNAAVKDAQQGVSDVADTVKSVVQEVKK